jgi:hypothetical protein
MNGIDYAGDMPTCYARLGFIEVVRRDVTYATTRDTCPTAVMRSDLRKKNCYQLIATSTFLSGKASE